MKIIPLAIFTLLANINLAFCPDLNVSVIEKPLPVVGMSPIEVHYSPLVDKIYYHEAGRNPNAYNPVEEATGGLQIRPIRLKHYNDLTGKNYTLEDMYDFNKAKEVFLYFCNHDRNGNLIPWKSFEKASKDWNGSGPKTITYWNAVKALL